MEHIFAIVIGYTIGSVPFAFLLSRRHGIDLRVVGSGNVGATNVLRTSGVAAGVLAMVLDAAKGWLAVVVAQAVSLSPHPPVLAGVASILGHVYPVWLGFRGGKGVATAAGVFLGLAPAAVAIAAGVFVVAVLFTRFISLGSLSAALTLAVATVVLERWHTAIGALIAATIIVQRHRGNITRLIAGTERRIGQRLI
jgi:glycerol-3-phosphate acyltransferase PlsY